MVEYVDHLHEHFIDPVTVGTGATGCRAPGYSVAMQPASLRRYTVPDGQVWRGDRSNEGPAPGSVAKLIRPTPDLEEPMRPASTRTRRLSLAAAALLATVTVVLVAVRVPAEAAVGTPIKGVASGRCLDVVGQSQTDKARRQHLRLQRPGEPGVDVHRRR